MEILLYKKINIFLFIARSMQIYGNTTHLSRRYFARLWFTLTNLDLDGELALMQHLPISIKYQVTGIFFRDLIFNLYHFLSKIIKGTRLMIFI